MLKYIGEFGTCGSSDFRKEKFEPAWIQIGAEWYNPQKEDWNSRKEFYAAEEAKHLAEDMIVLLPITDETYALGSLTESGYNFLQAMRFDDRREFVIYVSPTVKKELDVDDPEKGYSKFAYAESIKLRALVRQHILRLNYANIFVARDLDDMVEITSILWKGLDKIFDLRESRSTTSL